jgi:hypothetical protein
LLERVLIARWTSRENRDKGGVVFLEVAQHRNTDALKQFVGEDIAGDAPEMSHQEDSERSI